MMIKMSNWPQANWESESDNANDSARPRTQNSLMLLPCSVQNEGMEGTFLFLFYFKTKKSVDLDSRQGLGVLTFLVLSGRTRIRVSINLNL